MGEAAAFKTLVRKDACVARFARGVRRQEECAMTTKHTPGPWRVITDDDEYLPGEMSDFIDIGHCCFSAHAVTALQKNYNHDSAEEHLANARLIAAAPDLLEALSDTLAALQVASNAQEKSGDIVGASETQFKLRRARAAIAKAEGPLAGLRDAESGATPTTP